MASIDISFSRHLLALVQQDVRAFAPHIKTRKDAWVWCAGRDHWEFHGPDNYYWHGNACNAYEARANGWRAWLEKYSPGYAEGLTEKESEDAIR
jgi:hypothetical protein